MKCPQCNRSFDNAADSDLPVHHCPTCSGTWIGGRSLHAMLARSGDSVKVEQIIDSILDLDFRESRRRCPSCKGRHLKVVDIENTELDFCSNCKGLFFDPGELERVLPSVSSQAEKSSSQGGFWSSLLRMLDNP